MASRRRFSDIDDYFRSLPADARRILKEIRRVVRAAVPAASDTLGYQMPALRLERIFFYYAAFRNHIGIYPPVKGDAALQKALLPYRGEKGNLKFPLDQPIPYDLIARVASALARERSR